MKKPSKAPPDPEHLVLSIERVERSYYFSQYPTRGERTPATDEALLSLFGKISEVSARHRAHIGQPMEITLVCARDVDPFLLSVTLWGAERSAMAYLPADAFWALPALLADIDQPRAQLVFEPTRYGSGDLLSVWLGPATGLATLG